MRPRRRRARGLVDVLSPIDRLDLVIGPSPRRLLQDPEALAHLGDLYRRHRAEVWAATSPEVVPRSFWLFEPDIPEDLVLRHAAGFEPTRAEVLDRLDGIRR